MKRILTLLLVAIAALSAHAVLKEKDLSHTLQILRTELTSQHRELSQLIAMNKQKSEQVRKELVETMFNSNQNSLMLYSQKQEYVFDLTYACHEATEQYQQFQRQQLPFKAFLQRTESEIARYDSLIGSLRAMPADMLQPQAVADSRCSVMS